MTNPEVAILMLCLFIVLVLLGFPIAFNSSRWAWASVIMPTTSHPKLW